MVNGLLLADNINISDEGDVINGKDITFYYFHNVLSLDSLGLLGGYVILEQQHLATGFYLADVYTILERLGYRISNEDFIVYRDKGYCILLDMNGGRAYIFGRWSSLVDYITRNHIESVTDNLGVCSLNDFVYYDRRFNTSQYNRVINRT